MKTFTIDTETGGLTSYTDGLCSISIKELDKENQKTWLIKPQKKFYSYHAFKINKFDLDTLESMGEKLITVLDDIQLNFFNENKVRLIGHNIEFDLKFLMQACRDMKINLPIIEYIDTMQLAKEHLKKKDRRKRVDDGLENFKLVTIYEHLFPNDKDGLLLNAHSAEHDVLMTEKIFNELWKLEKEN